MRITNELTNEQRDMLRIGFTDNVNDVLNDDCISRDEYNAMIQRINDARTAHDFAMIARDMSWDVWSYNSCLSSLFDDTIDIDDTYALVERDVLTYDECDEFDT